LVVLSHLRWTDVWQRPQQLVSRMAADRRTWFVEAPLRAATAEPRLRQEEVGAVTRVWLELPGEPGEVPPELSGPAWQEYVGRLEGVLGGAGHGGTVWLYTPMALAVARSLCPRLTVYDVMDDLAAFADGGPHLGEMQRLALTEADLVFTGGRSLHRLATAVRGAAPTHLFPSGVETGHYAASRRLREARRAVPGRPVAGFVGVLDERLDRDLVAALAAALTVWRIELVGPVKKMDPGALPAARNLAYPGGRPYRELPGVMAGFDVALLPFVLGDATRSISPTKTLEYLAAGLPVVSTRIPDVVADWSGLARFADTGADFAAACRAVLDDPVDERDRRLAPLLPRYEWDAISVEMAALLRSASRRW
jgi:glycosyltransferase involved in cell wall biosynthesis